MFKYILLVLVVVLSSCTSLKYKTHMNYNTKHKFELITRTQLKLPIKTVRQSAIHALAYHEFGKVGINSTPLDRFKSQLDYLRDTGFSFTSTEETFKGFDLNEFRDKSVIITIDGEHKSILEAHKILKSRNLPYILLINPNLVGQPERVTWDDLQKIIPYKKMTFGVRAPKNWARAKTPITKEQVEALKYKMLQYIGFHPHFFAYSQGQYTPEFIPWLKEAGFKGAFTYSSGVITEGTNRFVLPRFPMTRLKGKLTGFEKTGFEQYMATLPFGIKIKGAKDFKIKSLPQTVQFSISPQSNSQELTCFLNGDKLELKKIRKRRSTYSFRLSPRPGKPHYWLTCTRPAAANESNQPLRFRWQTVLLVSQ